MSAFFQFLHVPCGRPASLSVWIERGRLIQVGRCDRCDAEQRVDRGPASAHQIREAKEEHAKRQRELARGARRRALR